MEDNRGMAAAGQPQRTHIEAASRPPRNPTLALETLMPLPSAPDQKPLMPARRQAASDLKANNELLIKGVLCVLIGLAVLVSPYFITSPGMQGIVAKSSLVGWFALVLGCAFLGVGVRKRMAANTKA
jgi:hypothetical protein